MQALLEMGIALHDVRSLAHLPKVVVLTKGARQTPLDTQHPAGIAAAPLVSAMRALSSELPELQFQNIDLTLDDGLSEDRLADVVLAESDESELALRPGKVFAARLKLRARHDLPLQSLQIGPQDGTNFKATMTSPGVIDHLDLFECPRPDLAPDEVRIRVCAVGLNFRDIMAVTGLLPEDAEAEPAWQNLGLEFSGDVVEIGADVTGTAIGDRVMGMYKNCMQRFLALPEAGLIRMPDDLAYDAAVTIPSAFATAHYALNEVGRLAAGDKVLIHVATGGVGLAAIQMAQAAGAEIFATAGSDAKRAVLRDLGVPHILNSRSLDYADDIMTLTQGRGVDVILNSLPGSHIDKGLDLLAPYGRFLEIGKRDVYADHAIGMKVLRRNLGFHIIDLAAMGNDRPDLLAHQMSCVMDGITAGRLKPLPTTTFEIADLRDAFRYMSQAKHVGKVVVTFDAETWTIKGDRDKPVSFRADASYLITGGTRGFSLALADWMSRQGAGRLLLASRSGRVAEEDQPAADAMRARGTDIVEVALDVTDAEAVRRLVLETAADQDKPLAGILHGAAVIKDTLITMMTPEVLEDVLRPKVIGGWALHLAERELPAPLDFLIGFSSVAQVIGSLGQSNYVAANSFLDALAEYRGQTGYLGGTVDWGVIADAGFVARDEQLASYLETAGMAGVTTTEAEHGLGTLLHSDASRFCFARGDWQQVGRANTALGRTPRYKAMTASSGSDDSDLAKRLATLSGDALVSEIAIFVTSAVSDLLKVDLKPEDINMPMSEAGLDSLSSFELKMKLETELGVSILASHFLKGPTIAELSQVLADAFDAERTRRAALGQAGEGDDDAASTAAQQTRRFPDGQIGLVALSVARFTSLPTRLALEHRVVFDIPEDTPDSDLQQAIYALFAEHPLLGLTCSVTRGEPPILAFGDAPRLADGFLDAQKPLDVAQGSLLRIGRLRTDATSQIQIVMHAALGDRDSLSHLQAALITAVTHPETPVTKPRQDARQCLSGLAYQPGTEQGMRDRAFWDHSLRQVPGPVVFARRARALPPEALGRDHGFVRHATGSLATPMTSEAGVMMAYAAALRQSTGGAGAVLMARDVAGCPNPDMIGPFVVTLPSLVPPLGSDLWRIADFRRLVAASADHLAFDVQTAVGEFNRRFAAARARPNQLSFAFGDVSVQSAQDGVAQDVRLVVEPSQRGLDYCFSFDADVVSQAEQSAIIAAFEDALTSDEGQRSAQDADLETTT